MSKNPLCKIRKPPQIFTIRKLITSNVDSSPDTSLGAYGPRDQWRSVFISQGGRQLKFPSTGHLTATRSALGKVREF